MAYDFRTVSVDDIRPNEVALRSVDTEGEQFLNLARDIGRRGILQPVLVRARQEADGTEYFELCDGLQRYTAARENGLSEVPVRVESLNDAEMEETQIVANLCKVDTKPMEFTRHLLRMLARNTLMTEAELAEMISQSTQFVQKRLGLLKLVGPIQELVNNGDIPLVSAYELSKLPHSEQPDWLDQAMEMSPADFTPLVKNRVKEIKDAAREGRKADGPTFTPTPKVRKLKELEAEFENPVVGPQILHGVTDVKEAYRIGLSFAMSTDVFSVSQQRENWENATKKRELEKAQKAAEREEKRKADAEAKASKARELVEELVGA